MSDNKKPEAQDVELKDLHKETLEKQIESGKQIIEQAQQQITQLQNQIQQQIGIVGYTQHLLSKFKFSEKPKEEPKKKTDLEVK